MKNLFTKLIFSTLLCSFSLLVSAQCPVVSDANNPSDITLSIDTININNAAEELSPESLMENYGYSEQETFVTWEDPEDCGNLAYTYEDNLFDYGDGSVKILRSWTVIDWLTGDVIIHNQIIRNIIDLGSYCLPNIVVAVSPWTCTASISVYNLLAGGFEYDDIVTIPSNLTDLELGETNVNITGTVAGETFECSTIVTVIDNTPPVPVVLESLELNLDPNTCTATLYPEDIDNGTFDSCSGVSLSISPSTFSQEDAGTEVIVVLTAVDEFGNTNSSWTTVTINDCGTAGSITCIGLTTASPLQDDDLQLYPEDFLSSNPNQSDDLSLTITDSNGNIIPNALIPQGSFGSFSYIVTDNVTGDSCSGTLNIPMPSDPCQYIACNLDVDLILAENGTVDATLSDLGHELEQCSDIVIVISDLDGNVISSGSNSVSLNSTGTYYFSLETTEGNSCWGTLNVLAYVPCPNVMSCNDDIFVSMAGFGGSQSATINGDMLLEGNYTGCDLSTFSIEIEDAETGDNTYSGVGSVLVDQPGIYNYTITNPSNNNSCWGTLNIQGTTCFGINDVTFPEDINIAINNMNEDNIYDYLTPDNLISVLGFSYNDVYPNWPNSFNCENLFSHYTDQVIEIGDGSFKVIREWTVLDWLTAEIRSEVQIIKNIVFPGLICDFLPNTAPLGDCESGHTDEDDVEWPADLLNIADYRIKPSELELYSNVDPSNSKPIFVNNESLYSVDYIDILNQFEINQLTIGRVWTVSSNENVVGTYSQKLLVDISDLSSLVSVNTMFDRPIPEVDLNNITMTNNQGVAFIEGEDSLSPIKFDDAYNGVTIKDLILIQQYLLSLRELDDYQLLAADINNDNSISAADIIELRKVLLNMDSNADMDWFFIENTENIEANIEPKANYIGIKPGDVDDDAVLRDPILTETGIMLLSDVLVNNGEKYETTLEYEGDDLSLGVEIHLYYDESLIQIDELYVNNPDLNLDYNISVPGEIHLTLTKFNGSAGFLFADENLINIKFTATANGVLSQAISSTSVRNSYLMGLDYNLVVLLIEMENIISTGIHNTDNTENLFDVYPNPASDIVTFDFIEEIPNNYSIQLFDPTGKLITDTTNENKLNVAACNPGMYIYRLIHDGKAYSGHISIVK